jgi:hypothetical protein
LGRRGIVWPLLGSERPDFVDGKANGLDEEKPLKRARQSNENGTCGERQAGIEAIF